jgi:preprotein translocase subunit SecF
MVQWVKSTLNIDWVGKRRYFYFGSLTAIVLTVGALIFNTIFRGAPLNYGTDFAGGTEIRIEFASSVKAERIRGILERSGFSSANAVKVSDPRRPYFYLVRLSEVTAFSPAEQARLKATLARVFGAGLASFDYRAGSDKLYLRFGAKVQVGGPEVERAVASAGVEYQQVQRFGKAEERVFEVSLVGVERKLRLLFDGALGQGTVKDIPQIQAVGPKMGAQLRMAGVKSVIYSLLLILLYVALRFDFRYAPGGVIALAHDVFITTGLIALTWTEFSMTAVAALLTLAGYSINDTIVIYDRIREDIVRYRDRKFSAIVNTAINECMSRTLLTSFTVLLSVIPMWLLGTGDVATFAFLFTFGALIGCYSTVAIASPLVVFFHGLAAKHA